MIGSPLVDAVSIFVTRGAKSLMHTHTFKKRVCRVIGITDANKAFFTAATARLRIWNVVVNV